MSNDDTLRSPRMSKLLVTEKHRIRRCFFDHKTGRTYGALADIPGRRELDERTLPIYLRLGYVPGTATLFRGVDCLPGGCELSIGAEGWEIKERFRFATIAPELAEMSEPALLGRTAELFRRAVGRAWSGRQAVLPLSGGLDSRVILGALLERTPAKNIVTYTYGLPGTLDFEIGNRVASWAGTRHFSLDLRDFVIDEAKLRQIALLSDSNTELMSPTVWSDVLDRFGRDVVYWSGFTGDVLAGSHYEPQHGGAQAAVDAYLIGDGSAFRYFEPEEWRPEHAWPVARETKYDGLLSAHEAIWFENHIERYTAHHIFMQGVQYATPYMDDELTASMLALPPRLRRGKAFFNRFVVATYPELFAIPTVDHGYRLARRPLKQLVWRGRTTLRKAARRVLPALVTHPRAAYTDLAQGMRRAGPLQDLVRDAIASLVRRGILDSKRIQLALSDHEGGVRNRFSLLALLTSLEVSMRVYCDEPASGLDDGSGVPGERASG
jgi:hypothetical protein